MNPNKTTRSTNWNALLTDLKLTGPTLALAQHCTIRELTNDLLHLTIESKYAVLLNTKHQQRIQDAFVEHKNHAIKVTITIAEHENKIET